MNLPFAILGQPGLMEMLIILGIGVLLFGKRLPEVGRSLGKGIMEFKKGIRGIEDEIDSSVSSSSSATTPYEDVDDYDEPTAPKFEPPSAAPKAAADESEAESYQI